MYWCSAPWYIAMSSAVQTEEVTAKPGEKLLPQCAGTDSVCCLSAYGINGSFKGLHDLAMHNNRLCNIQIPSALHWELVHCTGPRTHGLWLAVHGARWLSEYEHLRYRNRRLYREPELRQFALIFRSRSLSIVFFRLRTSVVFY